MRMFRFIHDFKHKHVHRYIPMQVFPFPLNPSLHMQSNVPFEFVQLAFGSQSCVFVRHSSRSKEKRYIVN